MIATKLTSLLTIAASLFAAGLAAPVEVERDALLSGDFTHYSPSAGLGACGQQHADSELVAALSPAVFDPQTPGGNPNNNPLCGRRIKAHYQGKTATVMVVDRCPGCVGNDLDLSPAAFEVFAPLSAGRIQGTWEWA